MWVVGRNKSRKQDLKEKGMVKISKMTDDVLYASLVPFEPCVQC